MATKLSKQLREFMEAVGNARRECPGVPSDEVVRLQARLVIEEAFEFLEALFGKTTNGIPNPASIDLARAHVIAADVTRYSAVNVDLAKAADALADLDYVSEHARQAFGIDGEPIADEVHRANMSKVGGPKDPTTGKQLKPPGWKPPDIVGCLTAQATPSTGRTPK